MLDALVLTGVIVLLHRLIGGSTWLAVSWWVTVAYFFLFESTFGQTVGKNAVGIRVVRRDGGPPAANSIAVRNVVRVIEEPLIALIAIFASGRRCQRFGDMFAGTTVGLERASVRPYPSPLQVIYPALWAALGVAMLLFVHPVKPLTLGSAPAGGRASASAGATTAYLTRVRSLCRARDRQIARQPRAAVDVVVNEELAYTRRVAAVPAPPTMLGLRESLLEGRRRFDRALLRMQRRLRASDHPEQLVGPLSDDVADVATASNDRFYRAGILCSTKRRD